MHRIWTPPPVVMKTVVELFNEDRLVHLNLPHVFSIPCLMTHLWIKQLSKDADFFSTVYLRQSFWTCSMHGPLIMLIVLPLALVTNYRGPWALQGIPPALEVQNQLEAGFKHPGLHG